MNADQRQALIGFGTAMASVGFSRIIARDSKAAPFVLLAGAALVWWLTRPQRQADDVMRARITREALRARGEGAELYVPAGRAPVTIDQPVAP